MARNRKTQAAAIRFAPALWALLLCLLIGGAGIGYVWLKNQIYELGQQIRTREQRLAGLRDQNEKLRRYLGELRSPGPLDRRVRELNLGLGPPNPFQVRRLVEWKPGAPISAPASPIVAQQARAVPPP